MKKYIAKTALSMILVLTTGTAMAATLFNDVADGETSYFDTNGNPSSAALATTTTTPTVSVDSNGLLAVDTSITGGNLTSSALTGTTTTELSDVTVNTTGTTSSTFLDYGGTKINQTSIDNAFKNLTDTSKISDITAPAVLASGRVNKDNCATIVNRGQALNDAAAQRSADIYAKNAQLPSTGAISCAALHQSRIANVAIDLLKSNGVQGAIFGKLGSDANSLMSKIGISSGLAKVIGSSLLSSLKITGLGPLQGILGGGPIKVDPKDCKLMEQLSKPKCILGSDSSTIARKDGDGTSAKCIDDAALAGILGSMAMGNTSGTSTAVDSALGSLF